MKNIWYCILTSTYFLPTLFAADESKKRKSFLDRRPASIVIEEALVLPHNTRTLAVDLKAHVARKNPEKRFSKPAYMPVTTAHHFKAQIEHPESTNVELKENAAIRKSEESIPKVDYTPAAIARHFKAQSKHPESTNNAIEIIEGLLWQVETTRSSENLTIPNNLIKEFTEAQSSIDNVVNAQPSISKKAASNADQEAEQRQVYNLKALSDHFEQQKETSINKITKKSAVIEALAATIKSTFEDKNQHKLSPAMVQKLKNAYAYINCIKTPKKVRD